MRRQFNGVFNEFVLKLYLRIQAWDSCELCAGTWTTIQVIGNFIVSIPKGKFALVFRMPGLRTFV